MTRCRAFLLCLLFLSVRGGVAFAHARLDHAVPAVGCTVHAPPAGVRLWFDEELDPASCSLRVLDGMGERVDRNDARVAADDRTLLEVSLTPLTPGTYKVIWRVSTVDAHMTEGDFTFCVEP